MGKKQRDCVTCGAPVGYLDRLRRCRCRCRRRIEEQAAKAACPACGKDRVLQKDTGRCITCSRVCEECGHPVRASHTRLCRDCRRKTEKIAAQQVCPRCGRPPVICAKTPAGATTVPGLARTNSHRGPVASAASCGGMLDSGCAQHAGKSIPADPSSAVNTSVTNSLTRRSGWMASSPMLRAPTASPGPAAWSRTWADSWKTSSPTRPRPCWSGPASQGGRWAPSPVHSRIS